MAIVKRTILPSANPTVAWDIRKAVVDVEVDDRTGVPTLARSRTRQDLINDIRALIDANPPAPAPAAGPRGTIVYVPEVNFTINFDNRTD